MFESIQALDLSVLFWVRSFHWPPADYGAGVVAFIANKGWLWWLIAAACFIRGRKDFSVHLTGALLIAMAAGLPLKGLIGRARPGLYAAQQFHMPLFEIGSTEHSFPSGHTLLAAVFAFIVVRYWKDYRAWLAFAFAAVVAVARVFQGMHWPSDVIGSILLGAVAACAADYVVKWPPLQRLILKPSVSGKVEAGAENSQQQLVGSIGRQD